MAEEKKGQAAGRLLLGCLGLSVLSCVGVFGWSAWTSQTPEFQAEQAQKQAQAAEAKAKKEAEQAAAIAALPGHMRAIAAALPADPAALPTTCPASKSPGKPLHLTDAAALRGWGADHWTPPGGEWDSWSFRRTFNFYPFANGEDPAKMGSTNADMAGKYGREIEAAGVLGVWVPQGEAWPKATGDSFDGGYFDGWLVVYDYATNTPACALAVKAENHDTVTTHSVKVKGIKLGGGLQGAIEGDLVTVFQENAEAALKPAGYTIDL